MLGFHIVFVAPQLSVYAQLQEGHNSTYTMKSSQLLVSFSKTQSDKVSNLKNTARH